jgi:hypothetical protein
MWPRLARTTTKPREVADSEMPIRDVVDVSPRSFRSREKRIDSQDMPSVALYRTSSGRVTLVPRKSFESISRYTSSKQASASDDSIFVPQPPCHPYLLLTKKRSADTETRRKADRRSRSPESRAPRDPPRADGRENRA